MTMHSPKPRILESGARAREPSASAIDDVRAFSDVLPAAILERVVHATKTLDDSKRHTTSGWFALDGRHAAAAAAAAARPTCVWEEPIAHLLPLVMRSGSSSRPGSSIEQLAGVEWWCRVEPEDRAKTFHFDKDEQLFAEKAQLVHPTRASVLYLVDRGGPTIIVDQTSRDGVTLVPRAPTRQVFVSPKKNRFLVFPGNLLHAVRAANTETPELRMTVLYNWWKAKPTLR
jgi:hypothetical protein